jgi:hypothetical protein
MKEKTLILSFEFLSFAKLMDFLLQNKFLYFFSHIALIPIVITSSNYLL